MVDLWVNKYYSLNSNLNDGSGEPCAGQVNATDWTTLSSNATRFSLDENFGILLPIGSENKKYTLCFLIPFVQAGLGSKLSQKQKQEN